MTDEYKTISSKAEGFFKDKSSKFYAFAYPVKNDEEISFFREKLRKEYHDARHHVYAYRLGAEKKIFRASDDGEPSNSSGPPILGQIKSHDLTDILIVVVRYFGGTKLGIPGLINAYKSAADEAIKNSDIITKTVNKTITVKFEYPQMNNVMRVVKEEKVKLKDQKFELSCEITIEIRLSCAEKVLNRFKKNHEIKVIEDF